MAKFPIVEVVKATPSTVANFVAANEGTILPVGSIVFSGVAIVAAAKNSNDILSIIGDANDALKLEADPEMRKKIYISAAKDLAPKVGPIVIFYGASIACTIVNKKHTDKKIAELTAALGLAQTAITQYQLWQKQAEQELGEKVEVVNKAVAEEHLKQNPDVPTVNEQIPSANEMYLYYDIQNQRTFWSERSPREIEDWCAQSSYDLYDGNVMNDILTQNDFYDFMGKGLKVAGCDYYIWSPEHEYHGQRSSDLVKVWITPVELPDGRLARSIDPNARPSFQRR